MEKAEETRTYGANYRRPKVNFFGKRGKTMHAAPNSEGAKDQRPSPLARRSDGSAGRPYFPSNGHHRHLNFLGRTSWGRKDKLLVNRR